MDVGHGFLRALTLPALILIRVPERYRAFTMGDAVEAGGGRRWIVAILAVALTLRLAALLFLNASLAEDRDAYLGIAQSLAEGRGYSSPGSTSATAYRPPLYPVLIAGLLLAGGTLQTLGIIQAALGTVAVWLTYRAGQLWLGSRPAALAAAIVAVEPLGLVNTSLVMTETIATFLLAAWLVGLATPAEREPSGDGTGLPLSPRRYAGRAFWTGVIAGLATLCRPIMLPTTLVGQVWSEGARVRMSGRSDSHAIRMSLISLLAFLAGLVLTLAPWTVRNWLQFGQPIVTTTHGGYTLLLGHNPSYSREVVHGPAGAVWPGPSLEAWQRSVDAELEQKGIGPRDEVRRDRAMAAMAWQTIQTDPVEAVRSGATLLARLWSLSPRSTPERPIPRAVAVSILLFNVGLLTLALVGLISLVVTRLPLAGLLLVPPTVFTAMHSLYWADQRMRAPLVPVLALLAAWGVTCLRKWSRGTSVRPTASASGGAC